MRTLAIFKRILLQRRGDKRSLALLFLAPLIILALLYFLLQVPSSVKYRVGIENQTTNAVQKLPTDAQLTAQLDKSDKLTVVKVDDSSRATMNDHHLDAIIIVQDHKVDVTYANTDSSKTQIISGVLSALVQMTQGKVTQLSTQQAVQKELQSAVQSALEAAQKAAAEQAQAAGIPPVSAPSGGSSPGTSSDNSTIVTLPAIPAMTITSHYLYGTSKLNLFDNLAPILVSFFVFFFVFLISGISLVNERSSGTLIRMLVTPIRRSEIISGYTLAYGLLAVVQTLLVVLFARYVLDMKVIGNFGWVLVINFLIAVIAMLIGLLLSALAKTEFQFMQFIPVAVVTQFLFSGIISVDTMSQPLQWLAHLMPLYYGIDALQKVIKQGLGFAAIWLDLGILFGIAILLYLLNVVALKNLRRT